MFLPLLSQATSEMEEFADKVAVFGNMGDGLGEEHDSFVECLRDCAQIRAAVRIQYVESALAYALSYLSQPDQGAGQGKSPDALKKVLAEQFNQIATHGLDEGMVQPALLASAKALQG